MNQRALKNLISLRTIVSKEVWRFLRIWTQTLLPPVISMTLYFIIFGKMIGSQIHNIHGYTYMQYIVPGLVMMSAMSSAYANSSSSFFLAKFTRSIDEMLVSSMPPSTLLFGFLLGGILRGMLIAILVILISVFFTHMHILHLGLAIVIAVLSASVFSLGGMINAIFAKKFDDIAFIPTFVITPLTYLGGVFYSISQLTEFWRSLSLVNPVAWIVDSFRFSMLGVSDLNIYFGLGLVIILFFVLLIWAYVLLKKGVGIKT